MAGINPLFTSFVINGLRGIEGWRLIAVASE